MGLMILSDWKHEAAFEQAYDDALTEGCRVEFFMAFCNAMTTRVTPYEAVREACEVCNLDVPII